MGKLRHKNKYGLKTKALSRKTRPGPETSEDGVDELLISADSSMNELQFEAAKEFCERALRVEPSNMKALDILSTVLLEIGDPSSAVEVLQKMIHLEPNRGFKKYLSMAQLCEGKDSLRYYTQGLALMENQMQEKENAASRSASDSVNLERELSSVYCAMAEIYMTDCCFEEDAEAACADLIRKALAADPSNPAALQCKVNYLLVQGEHEEAKRIMEHSLSLWLPRYQSIRENRLTNEEVDPVEVCPLSYDDRVGTSKLLIELEMYDEASEVLDGLAEEDDEVVDVWYLLGWLNYLRSGEYLGNARFYLGKAKEVAAKVRFEDEEEMRHVEELLAEIGEAEDDEDDAEEGDDLTSDSEEEVESKDKMEH